ncbi:histidine kinase [Pelagicoccus sp. SDUM812002]|uniref:histidine kinase n=1 Tax=Pelagicoccus sp. SDUM812002 TaxID=3041266 RepID=UPI00280D4614|nr:histidine kinase [Pelagicoccus sp. SDUM812002]MDQ8187491.1 histidine kinase [Pelagicoccus sp. SDUM812002]
MRLSRLLHLIPLALLLVSADSLHALDPNLGFDRIEIFERSPDTGDIIPASKHVIEHDYPFATNLKLVPLLPRHFEIRLPLSLKNDLTSSKSDVISLYLGATFELYFDQQLIGTNGILSPTGQEIEVGRSYNSFALPKVDSPQTKHTLRIRGTHTHTADKHNFIIVLNSLEGSLSATRTTTITYCLFLGFALFGVYLLAYFLLNRKLPQYLFLGLSCLLFSLYAVNKLFYYQLNVEYPNLDTIALIANFSNIALSTCAPIATLLVFGYRRPWMFLLSLAPLVASFTPIPLYIVPRTFLLCLGISLVALFQKRPHAFYSTLICSLLVASYQVPFLVNNQAYSFGVLMVFFLVSTINLLIQESRQRNQTQLRNARLQLELLKSKIQPHFVLNSLTSAIEWIETNPQQGVKLIQELAKEFDLLSAISEQALIPFETELESCRTYLRIMEYRKKARYELKLINVNEQAELPPAILRNLLENALSHNAYGQGHIVFQLRETASKRQRQFEFSAPYLGSETTPPPDGTGIKYIKARLAESYPNWSFEHGPQDTRWVTKIQLPK